MFYTRVLGLKSTKFDFKGGMIYSLAVHFRSPKILCRIVDYV